MQWIFRTHIKITAMPMVQAPCENSSWYAQFTDPEFSRWPDLKKVQEALQDTQSIDLDFMPVDQHVYYSKDMPKPIREDVYYIPEAAKEVGIDSIVMHDEYLYLFQSTVSTSHGIISHLQELSSQFMGLPLTSEWQFIFVVPDTILNSHCSTWGGNHVHYLHHKYL
jgi:hypothetical protein